MDIEFSDQENPIMTSKLSSTFQARMTPQHQFLTDPLPKNMTQKLDG